VEQTLSAWLIPAIALLAGIGIGFLIARLAPGSTPTQTQRKLDDIQERFDSQSYQDVQEHMSQSASRLALDENTRQRLLAALEEGPSNHREKLTPPHRNEPPKDYAPKDASTPGTLDATFGLRK
jgi:uncharacterized membrane-anchored protein YhcB (DUF1043 family)